MLKGDLNIQISRQTVARSLNEAGLKAAEKKKKPYINSRNMKKRFEFAKAHQHWTIEDWKRVIWTDESKVNRFQSEGRSWYWARDGESLQSHHVKQTVKFGGGSIMVWGCFTAKGPGFLCKIEERMDQYLYLSILEDELAKTIDYYSLDPEKIIFQQDNDPKHTAKSVIEYLSNQSFDLMIWPPQSPDLNPIENIWAYLKGRLNTYDSPPNGLLQLWERIETEWNKISKEFCLKLIESMPERMKAVLKVKGRWTKY